MDEKANGHSVTSQQELVQTTYIKPQARKLHDPDVTFEEYYYYSQLTRVEERSLPAPKTKFWSEIVLRKKADHDAGAAPNGQVGPTKEHTEENFANEETRMHISDEEWANASRAFRTASWGECCDDFIIDSS